MNPLNPLFALIIFGIAFLTAYLINLKYKFPNNASRFEGIDGLRGFLALAVFMHHAAIWYQYLHINSWEAPKSNLYNHFGETSVSLFFMITSYLFISKLLKARDSSFDWKYFYVSRVFRLVPLYYFLLTIMIVVIASLSHFTLQVSLLDLCKSIFHWGVFTITKYAQINKFELTSIMNAGVVWSLPYEWLFYFSLPILSLLILKKRPPLALLIFSLSFIVYYFSTHEFKSQHMLSFAGGAIAPFLQKNEKAIKLAQHPYASILILLSLISLVFFDSTKILACKLLIALIFTLIALGNTVFDVLKNSTLKFLGEICYSTYLLHGFVLFSAIYLVVGMDEVRAMTPSIYCYLIFAITPIVVLLSFLTFISIEKPFMNKAKAWK